jgi:hypothetical protein
MLKRAVQETITFIFAKENEEPGAEATVPVEEEAAEGEDDDEEDEEAAEEEEEEEEEE